MKRIKRKYAIIYIDNDGETLESDDYTTQDITTYYYQARGFLQWNFYLIIPKENIKETEEATVEEQIKAIEQNNTYTRKYVVEKDKIDKFVREHFPIIKKNHGKMIMIQADTFKEAEAAAIKATENNPDITMTTPSFNRDINLDQTLKKLDGVRTFLIKNPNLTIVFYTHIQNEYSLAEKKFKLFINETY